MWMMLAAGLALGGGFSTEAYVQTLDDGMAAGLGAGLHGGGGAFLNGEMRGSGDGLWIGRATAGLDLLGGCDDIDVTLGLFLGSTGYWNQVALGSTGTGGLELGIGGRIGDLHARYRHADGFRGPLEARLTENEWRLGYTVADTVELFGQYVLFNPGDDVRRGGFGAGATVLF